jgi:hypothetical protein
MTNDRIQKWLAGFSNRSRRSQAVPTKHEIEANEIIRFLAGPDGALQLADDAAWELIAGECRARECDGHVWWETGSQQLALDLEPETLASLSAAIRYLHARGLTIVHPKHAGLVRSE